MRLSMVAARAVAAAACLAACLTAGQVEAAPPKYSYDVVGDPADVQSSPTGGLALMGGGTELVEGRSHLQSPAATKAPQ